MKAFIAAINRLADAVFALAQAIHNDRARRQEYADSDMPF